MAVCMILGTDWWTDCDDAMAVRVLARAHQAGRIRLLGIGIDACMEKSAPSLDAFLREEGMAGLPIGLDAAATDYAGRVRYQYRLADSAADLRQNGDCPDAVALYRRLLAETEGPVEVLEIGFPQVLANLLTSGPDGASPRTGWELVQEKVRKLWVMGGKWDEAGGKEHNFVLGPRSRRAAAALCRDWPTEITFLGFEVGDTVIAGSHLPEGDGLHRVMADHGSPNGRSAWDPMLAYMAVLGGEEAAGYRRVTGWARVDPETGANDFREDPAGRHGYVVKTLPDSAYAAALDRVLEKTFEKNPDL